MTTEARTMFEGILHEVTCAVAQSSLARERGNVTLYRLRLRDVVAAVRAHERIAMPSLDARVVGDIFRSQFGLSTVERGGYTFILWDSAFDVYLRSKPAVLQQRADGIASEKAALRTVMRELADRAPGQPLRVKSIVTLASGRVDYPVKHHSTQALSKMLRDFGLTVTLIGARPHVLWDADLSRFLAREKQPVA